MSSFDRHHLLASLVRLAEEVYGEPPQTAAAARLRQRLEPLLDQCLLERQPVVEREVSILLADLRGFTLLLQQRPPAAMAALLNRWFSEMSEVILQHDGFIDKFMGDAVMALFGAPRGRPDDLSRALACAVAMQQRMLAFNRAQDAHGEPRLFAGIAISTGPVMAGSFGSAGHSEYTVIGDPVNLVSRIESFSLRGQVLLAAASRAAAGPRVEVGPPNAVWVKGLTEPVRIYELHALQQGSRALVVPRVEPRRSPRIRVDLPALFRRVEHKRIDDNAFVGHVHDLGYYGMRADLPLGLPRLAEVVVTLGRETGLDHCGEVYARVLVSEPRVGSYRTSLELTSIDCPGHRQVKRLVDEGLWRR